MSEFWNRVQIIQSYWLLHNFEKGNKEIHINHVLLELLFTQIDFLISHTQ